MRTRVESLNGDFEVQSSPQSGTKLITHFSIAAVETINDV